MGSVIDVRGVYKSFGSVKALDGLSFETAEGETLGFLGPNGCGKTTTVRLLNGVLFPDAGDISVLGLNPVKDGLRLRQLSGVVTETAALYENMTAAENLVFFARLYGLNKADAIKKADDLIGLLGLRDKRNAKALTLSTGQKKKLLIARSLVGSPRLLYLDEPTSGLDPEAARSIITLINELKSEKVTIFVCTHNLSEAFQYCDSYCFLSDGRTLDAGDFNTLKSRYLTDTEISICFKGELPKSVADKYGVSPSAGVADIKLASAGMIPGVVREIASCVDVYSVEEKNVSLESLYFAVKEKKA